MLNGVRGSIGGARKGTLALVATLVVAVIPIAAAADASAKPAAQHQTVKNGRILFQSYVGTVQQLFTIKPNGRGIRQITSGSQTSERGSWSPDGSKILFDRTPLSSGDGLGTIYRARANGTGVVSLTSSLFAKSRFAQSPAWSPSGRQIAFRLYTIQPYSDGIWVMNTDGSHLRQVTRGPGPQAAGPIACVCDISPRFSPNGRQIAFQRILDDPRAAVFRVNVDGTQLKRLTPWRLDAGFPRWSPDGSLIAYSSYWDPQPAKSSNLFTIRPNGTHVTQLTHHRDGNGNSAYPAWSPDGKLIVFARNRVRLGSHSRNDLYVMPAKGGRAKRLTHLATLNAGKPDWGTAR